MKIVYMGTPEFACKPLRALQTSQHQIMAVVTGREKRRDRSGKPCPTDVCCSAEELGLSILTPKSLKSQKLYDQLAELKPDLIVVIAFRILPERLFTLPTYGAINIHASLLPRYRGAAPINWALINGEKETGLTSFSLDRAVDTGNIILQRKTAIGDDENFDSLYARLSEMSGQFLLDTIDLIQQRDFEPRRQDNDLATPAPKISPFDCMIDFGFPAENVRNFVRGLSTKPAAYTFFRSRKAKILQCQKSELQGDPTTRPGTIIPHRKKLIVQCAGSAVEIHRIVPEGKKPMDGLSFLNGLRPKTGEIFGEIQMGAGEPK